jgi:hypothetical protein
MALSNLSSPVAGNGVVSMRRPAEIESYGPGIREARRISWFIFVLLIGFFGIILLAGHPGEHSLSPDVYWHVATGQRIWETASLPRVDEFSHTFQGHPWIAENWLAELMLFGAYSLEGWRGVDLLAVCTIAISYALLFLVLSRRLRTTVAIGIAVVAYAFSIGHFSARPLIFVDGLITLWTAALVNAVDRKTSPSLLLLPLMVLWANIHASFTFGLALAATLAAEAFFFSPHGQRARTAKRWAMFLAFAAVAACMTPYGYQPMLHTLQIFADNEALPYIQEWQPAVFQRLGINELTLLALLFLAMHKGVRIPAWRLIMVISLFYMMMSHIRFMSYFVILTPILLAAPLTRQFTFLRLSTQLREDPDFFRAMGRAARRSFYPACAVVLLGVIVDGAWGRTVAPEGDIAPAGAVDYIYREHLTGNIYNPYELGGYLIFRHLKTFIDGRTEQLFLNGFTTQIYDVIQKHPRMFIALLEKYNVTLALVVPDSIQSQELTASNNWEKVYADGVAELFRKRI